MDLFLLKCEEILLQNYKLSGTNVGMSFWAFLKIIHQFSSSSIRTTVEASLPLPVIAPWSEFSGLWLTGIANLLLLASQSC
jgi:hypothetical protein